jgi:prevent-host-death family protein
MEEIGLEEARRTLGEIVDRVRFTDEPTIITRQGKTAAFVVSADWYRAAVHALGGRREHPDAR